MTPSQSAESFPKSHQIFYRDFSNASSILSDLESASSTSLAALNNVDNQTQRAETQTDRAENLPSSAAAAEHATSSIGTGDETAEIVQVLYLLITGPCILCWLKLSLMRSCKSYSALYMGDLYTAKSSSLLAFSATCRISRSLQFGDIISCLDLLLMDHSVYTGSYDKCMRHPAQPHLHP